MSIEIKITGDTPEEVLKQMNGLVAAAGVVELSHTVDKPALRVVPDSAAVTNEDEDEPEAASGERPEVDKEGLPWDERIHANAKDPFKADGTWKRRKNISDEEWESVRAELIAKRDGTATPAEQPATAPAPAPAPQQAPAPNPVSSVETSTPAPSAPAPTTSASVADVDPLVAIKGALPKLLGTLNAKQAGLGNTVAFGLLGKYGFKGIPEITQDKAAPLLADINRCIAEPDNAESIVAGLM